jgi:hypothetical protein
VVSVVGDGQIREVALTTMQQFRQLRSLVQREPDPLESLLPPHQRQFDRFLQQADLKVSRKGYRRNHVFPRSSKTLKTSYGVLDLLRDAVRQPDDFFSSDALDSRKDTRLAPRIPPLPLQDTAVFFREPQTLKNLHCRTKSEGLLPAANYARRLSSATNTQSQLDEFRLQALTPKEPRSLDLQVQIAAFEAVKRPAKNNYERSVDLYSSAGQTRASAHRVPENLLVRGQSFNNFYSGVDDSLQLLMLKKQTIEQKLVKKRASLLQTGDACATLVQPTQLLPPPSPVIHDIAQLGSTESRIENLRRLKNDTRSLLDLIYKVDTQRTLKKNNEHSLKIIQEQMDEYNRRAVKMMTPAVKRARFVHEFKIGLPTAEPPSATEQSGRRLMSEAEEIELEQSLEQDSQAAEDRQLFESFNVEKHRDSMRARKVVATNSAIPEPIDAGEEREARAGAEERCEREAGAGGGDDAQDQPQAAALRQQRRLQVRLDGDDRQSAAQNRHLRGAQVCPRRQ